MRSSGWGIWVAKLASSEWEDSCWIGVNGRGCGVVLNSGWGIWVAKLAGSEWSGVKEGEVTRRKLRQDCHGCSGVDSPGPTGSDIRRVHYKAQPFGRQISVRRCHHRWRYDLCASQSATVSQNCVLSLLSFRFFLSWGNNFYDYM